jgi:hypothetical protein
MKTALIALGIGVAVEAVLAVLVAGVHAEGGAN